MPSVYCPSGHHNTYSGVKPKKCSVCQAPMETPSVAAMAAALPATTVPAIATARQAWPQQPGSPRRPASFHVQQADLQDDADFAFEGNLSISHDGDGEQAKPMTVEQLARSDTPVERGEERRSAPEGNDEVVTAAALVQGMVEESGGSAGGQVATASAGKRGARGSGARKVSTPRAAAPVASARAPRAARAPKGAS